MVKCTSFLCVCLFVLGLNVSLTLFQSYCDGLLFCVYTETSISEIFMLYTLIHNALEVEFMVVLWNRVYNLCTMS